MKRRQFVNAEEIAKRLASWQALTPAQQLAALDKRLGKGQGAAKQRKRIQAQMGGA